jgi:hypothetical protein
MVIELLRQRGDRGTVFGVPAVVELAVVFGAAPQIADRQVLLVSSSSVLPRLAALSDGCC